MSFSIFIAELGRQDRSKEARFLSRWALKLHDDLLLRFIAAAAVPE